MVARRIISPPPRIQAVSCATFLSPPLDGSLQLGEMIDWHEKYSPTHRIFLHADANSRPRAITWSECAKATRTASRLTRERISWSEKNGRVPVVAILATSDAIPYATAVLGVIRANYTVFPISIRNSPAAVAHLLGQVGVDHVLVGLEQGSQDLANEAIALLKAQNPSAREPHLSPMFTYDDLYSPSSEPPTADELPYVFQGPDAPVLISHSSGSTAFPKPITFSNSRLIEILLTPYYGELDIAGLVFSAHMSPMFHAMGLFTFFFCCSCGNILAVFTPASPPPVPTSETVIHAAKATDSTIIMAIPTFLETWSRTPNYVSWLATRKLVIFGGGPLNKEVGDFLVAQGVPIVTGYGSDWTRQFSNNNAQPDWEYTRLHRALTTHMSPQGDNTFELIVVQNEKFHPCIINTKVDGADAYATSDRLAPHPTLPGYWKIVGRTDDQIMHSTGEKTNPGPLDNMETLESMMMQDEHIAGCVMFGRGRFQTGVLIEPEAEYAFNPTDETKLAEFRNMIWPTMEKVNAYAPQHSRLFKEMVLVANPAKPFEHTAKGTIRRTAVIAQYEDEINAAYNLVEESSQINIPAPTEWNVETSRQFVRTIINKIIKHEIKDHDDLFHHGCDSLQATRIRNTLLRALRDIAKADIRKVPGNAVYEHPTIGQLADFALSIALGTVENVAADVGARIDAMHSMVVKYTREFPPHQATVTAENSEGDIVLLTGSTGSLGCYILAQLLSDPKVSHVFALNRPSRDHISLHERQRSALINRGLPDLVTSDRLTLVEGELADEGFGISVELYEEMRGSVTHVVHNAWRVDFKVALASFEQNVRGLRHLIDLALTSPLPRPPQVLFTSSVGVFQHARHGDDLPEAPIQAEYAVGTGYAESKWVSERILYEAAARTALPIMVVRVGQVTGGPDGAWNAHEWFPSLVQSAPVLKCFPDDKRAFLVPIYYIAWGVAWIQLNIAAAALTELRYSSSMTHTVHLVHPCPASWGTLAAVVARVFDVPLVLYVEWLARLEAIFQAVPGAIFNLFILFTSRVY
ncbi:uncharacterized protein FIBRA_01510 [Fibroporia radiculosa]|uniref:Polyketide synthase-like phosphopantetheine-binding domain-containing protein n=1 Tax=Fibroporia radiculosa TaxID=599839 RepID=J4HTG2_9APHY|nr:uncharacterized protein FIBRA_01510 [Fibroporia radiculosa]CCL99492.1 predicted protein [Fibroporia radiculosa]